MTATVVSWSGGKDAAYALYTLEGTNADVVELLTTISEEFDRSSMHGVRRTLYERQAAAIGLPIDCVSLPPEPTNEAYDEVMAEIMEHYRERGVRRVVFGDLCLEDIRAYREDRLSETGVDGHWPIWGRDTTEFAQEFLDAGFEAIVVTVDGERLGESFAGRAYDESFLADLPADVDPAGENGEFHTFVRDGPIFDEPVAVEIGETVARPVGDGEYFFTDLLPVDGE